MPEIRFKIGEEDHRALSERASSLEMKPSTYARSLMLRMLRKETGAAASGGDGRGLVRGEVR